MTKRPLEEIERTPLEEDLFPVFLDDEIKRRRNSASLHAAIKQWDHGDLKAIITDAWEATMKVMSVEVDDGMSSDDEE